MGDPNESALRWLHLSDLQIGLRGSLLTETEFRRAFERDLAEMHGETGPWDFVAITGDVALTGRPREYDAANAILSELWSYLASLGSRPTLLVVPGNHDDTRVVDDQGDVRGNAVKTSTAELTARFSAFTAWRERWERDQHETLARAAGLSPGAFVARMRRGALSVGIIGVNSTCAYDPGSGYQVSPEQVVGAAGSDLPSWSRAHHAVLLLSHHGPERWSGGTSRLPDWSSAPIISLAGGESAELETDVTTLGDFLHNPVRRPPVVRALGAPNATLIHGLHLRRQSHGYESSRAGYLTGGVHLIDGNVELRVRARRWSNAERVFEEMFEMPSPERALPRAAGRAIQMRPATLGGNHATEPTDHAPGVTAWAGLTAASREGTRQVQAVGRSLAVRERDVVVWSTQLRADPEAIAMSPGGRYVFVRYREDAEVFDVTSRHSVEAFKVPPPSRYLAVWVGDDRYAYDTGDHLIVRWVGTNVAVWFTGSLVRDSSGGVRALAAAADHRCLAYGTARGVLIVSWKWPSNVVEELPGRPVNGLAWRRDGSQLAIAHDGGLSVVTMRWTQPGWREPEEGEDEARPGPSSRVATIETQGPIQQLVFSPDERFVAGVTAGVVSLCVRVEDASALPIPLGLRAAENPWALVWEAAANAVQRLQAARTVTAKVVLLGEANAGKSSLALQLAEQRFAEIGPTQGMQFWPVTAAALDPSIEHPPGERREVVLWDMGGQDEYRLLHRAFLRDTTVALFVVEPRRGAAAFDELVNWLPQLREKAGVVRLLVGSKLDDDSVPRDALRAAALCDEGTFQAYLETSARTPLGIAQLGAAIARAIDWSKLGITVRSALFQRIRDYINVRRESGRVVMSYPDLEEMVRQREGESFDRRAVDAVVETMNRQGFIADLRMADGTRMLVLDVSHVERYGGSLILAARDNPRGVPALDRSTITAPGMVFPRIPPDQRLPFDQELVVLDAVIQTLIEHGICFPSSGTLVFPSLFRGLGGVAPPPPVGISTRFDFVGASDVVYAALVSALAMNNRSFGPPSLWPDHAQFTSDLGVCGLRLAGTPEQRRRGSGHLEVFYSLETSDQIRRMFVGVVEALLRDLGLTVEERPAVVCACGRTFDAQVVRGRLDSGKADIGCEDCDRRTPLLPAADAAAEGGAIAAGIRVFRTELEQKRSELVSATKADLNNARKEHDMPGPVRILHLSDLHIGANADVVTLLQPLLTDLRDASEGLGERLDYLVISGDITNRASPAEFDRAREFVQHLLAEIEVSAERCIVVPGNHDQSWAVKDLYQWDDSLDPDRVDPEVHVAQGAGWLVRNDAVYASRFAAFSERFYHPLFLREYPSDPALQGGSVLFDEHHLQFLTFNSSWQIDKWFRGRSSLHPGAVSRTIMEAEAAVRRAKEEKRLGAAGRLLRLAVWHHPLTGNEKIEDDAFAENLRKAEVNACLHGHVHQDRADVVGYLHPTRKLHVIGAGSFAAPDEDRPASTPQLYNVMEIHPHAIRVHTRSKRRGPGAWEPWAQWPVTGGKAGERQAWYEIPR